MISETSEPRSELAGIAVEGACGFFFGRPLEKNPYAEGDGGDAWRFGWSEASWFDETRGKAERRRWRQPRRVAVEALVEAERAA